MAAPCREFARTVLLRGLDLVPCRLVWTRCRTQPLQPLCVLDPVVPQRASWPYRPLHLSSGPALSTSTSTSTNTDPQKTTGGQKKEKAALEEDEEDEGPEYIPTRKAKNPMMTIAYAWMVGLPAGIIGFILAKREVDKNRLDQLRVRQRMKRSNEGEYEGSRFRNTATAELD